MLHLSIITWHSCYILVYMDPLAYCLTSIWSSFGMFAASALLVVLENPPAHSSLYGPRNAVQDDTSLRHGVAVGHGLKRQPTQPGDNSADFDSSYVLFFWGGVGWWLITRQKSPEGFLLGPWKVFLETTDGLCNQNLVDVLFHSTVGEFITYPPLETHMGKAGSHGQNY